MRTLTTGKCVLLLINVDTTACLHFKVKKRAQLLISNGEINFCQKTLSILFNSFSTSDTHAECTRTSEFLLSCLDFRSVTTFRRFKIQTNDSNCHFFCFTSIVFTQVKCQIENFYHASIVKSNVVLKGLRFPNAPHSRYGNLILLLMLMDRNT